MKIKFTLREPTIVAGKETNTVEGEFFYFSTIVVGRKKTPELCVNIKYKDGVMPIPASFIKGVVHTSPELQELVKNQ